MEMEVGNWAALHWLWAIAGVLAIAAVATAVQRRAIQRFATANLLPRFHSAAPRWRRLLRFLMLSLMFLTLVVTLLDLRWGKVWREVPQRGIEVVFVLDVSRSMLAEDATPSRLERAKQQILDTVDTMAGDRIGLVIFAGETKQVVPLTSHYEDFRQALESVGPHSLRRGGSQLGDAIRDAAETFLAKTHGHKAMMIFTDGEDQESAPVEAAREVAASGVRIFTIGLGDMDEGALVPASDGRRGRDEEGYLRHEGELVVSRLNGEILREVAEVSDGAYIPAGTKLVDMEDVYHGYVGRVEQQEFETARINQYEARFQWFLAAAIGLLIAEIFLAFPPRRRRAAGRHSQSDGQAADVASPSAGGGRVGKRPSAA